MRGRVLITVSPSLAGGEGSRSTRPVRVINGESIGYRPFSEYVESQLPKWEVTRRITVDPYARRPRGRDDATFCGRGGLEVPAAARITRAAPAPAARLWARVCPMAQKDEIISGSYPDIYIEDGDA